MYSRYKPISPAPPPDYDGTAFQSSVPPSSGAGVPEGLPVAQGLPSIEIPTEDEGLPEVKAFPEAKDNRAATASIADSPIDPTEAEPSLIPSEDAAVRSGAEGLSGTEGIEAPEESAVDSREARPSDDRNDRAFRPAAAPRDPLQAAEDRKIAEAPPTVVSSPNPGSDLLSVITGLTLDDLLFFSALLRLLFGKESDESILFLSYLLTCGL